MGCFRGLNRPFQGLDRGFLGCRFFLLRQLGGAIWGHQRVMQGVDGVISKDRLRRCWLISPGAGQASTGSCLVRAA